MVTLAVGIKIVPALQEPINQQAIADTLPVEAVAYIEDQEPQGELFNSYNWGGYIVWALYPEYPSFVDGRTDLFDDALLNDYLSAWRAEPGWEQFLANWNIHLVLIEPEAPLVNSLSDSNWDILYQDDQAVLLAKR
jgi:hypothetical protein